MYSYSKSILPHNGSLQIEYCEDKEKVIEDEHDADGGWVDTHHYDNSGSPTVEEKVRTNKATLN